jgi:hypothetical protein
MKTAPLLWDQEGAAEQLGDLLLPEQNVDNADYLPASSPAFPIRLSTRWRVTFDPRQWRLEHLSRSRWDGSAYCVTRDALLRNIRERCGPVSADALGLIESLPPFHPDRGMSP